jgi:hypothetical protein
MGDSKRLHDIGRRHGTDKVNHGYLGFYEKHLDPTSIASLLEMGIYQGASLRMWQEWLPEATIEGWDVDEIEVEGCVTKVVNQNDREAMATAAADVYDVIVDDAGHFMRGMQTALSFLFPRCRTYIVEDLYLSWSPGAYEASDVSTYHLLTHIEDEGWPSPWATEDEARYIADNAELVDVFFRGDPAHPRSASAILRNRSRD